MCVLVSMFPLFSDGFGIRNMESNLITTQFSHAATMSVECKELQISKCGAQRQIQYAKSQFCRIYDYFI